MNERNYTNSLLRVDKLHALEFAIRYSVSGYDARQFCLVDKPGVKLVIDNKTLLTATPDVTISLEEAFIL